MSKAESREETPQGDNHVGTIITDGGAVKLTDNIVVDGHCDMAVARVTTHIHSDHIAGLSRSTRRAALLIATPLTHDLLEAMGYKIPSNKRIDASYETPLRIEDETIILLRANHVPGASQVLIERDDGVRLGYTGDFKLPGTDVMEDLDILVVDATYGKPEWRRPWQEEMDYLLPELVLEKLIHGPVHIYAYNGKVEEVMLLLRRGGVDAPIILPRKKARILSVLQRHGYRVSEVYVEGSAGALEAARSGWYVRFHHFGEWKRRGRVRGYRMLLTGWEFTAPFREVGSRDIIVSFSDHADFDQLVSYVSEARPRLLVVDAARGGDTAFVFAEYARRKLGLNAVAQPGGGAWLA